MLHRGGGKTTECVAGTLVHDVTSLTSVHVFRFAICDAFRSCLETHRIEGCSATGLSLRLIHCFAGLGCFESSDGVRIVCEVGEGGSDFLPTHARNSGLEYVRSVLDAELLVIDLRALFVVHDVAPAGSA